MMTRPRLSGFLLATTASAMLFAGRAPAQTYDGAGEVPDEESEEVVVTGQRERGAVATDIQPEEQLRAADIRALGISSISDLLTELGPQLESASGKPPVVLLEGHRIASFREIASLPAEAIARVDILPEEVGLRYGYGADQKVLNVVLRQRFRAFTGELTGSRPTQGGGGGTATAEGGFLAIRRGQRININGEYSNSGRLMEMDRGLDEIDSPARSLSPAREQFTLDMSYHRPLTERTQATLSGEITTTRSESDIGLALRPVTIPGGTPYAPDDADLTFQPFAPGIGALARTSSVQTGQLGLTVTGDRADGQWTLTATYDRQESRGITSRPFDLAAYAAAVAAGDPAANPDDPVAQAFLTGRPSDLTTSRSDNAEVDFLYNRSLATLPAGDISATVKLGASLLRQESTLERNLLVTARDIGRDSVNGSLSLDVPLARTGAIGRLSANGNVAIEHLSDAGTIRTFGGGLNWTPVRAVSLSASYNDEETAPTASQLGDPQTFTPLVPVFDYVRGETALVTTITGGNPGLGNATTRNWRLGLQVTPLQNPSVRISINLNDRRTSGDIAAFPGITADTALAFPDRFVRDADGHLLQVDLRPINITEQHRTSLRWGVNFSKRLRTPQSQINALREAFRERFPNGAPGRPGTEGAPDGQGAGGQGMGGQGTGGPGGNGTAGADGGRGPGGGGGGPRFGGGSRGGGGGRINVSLYHEWTFTNTAQFASSLPQLDLLDGESLGNGSPPSRHKVELQAGVSQSGLGLRLTGTWNSATRIDGVAGEPSSQLHFDDLATFNLRLFANLGQLPSVMRSHSLLRGVRVQLSVDNLLNARQHVTDGNGDVPLAFRPAYLDPLGRVVRLSIRKLIF